MTYESAIDQMTDFLTVMEAHLRTATLEMFEASGVPVTATQTRLHDEGCLVAAAIGFAAEKLRGALILRTSVRTVRSWRPDLADVDVDDAVIRDTIGEFSNMLLGRLKNRLLGSGVTLMLAVPTTAFGANLCFAASGISLSLPFSGPAGLIDVRLDTFMDVDFAFAADPAQRAAGREGETLLF